MNLIRTAFWLSIVILLLPTGREGEGEGENSAEKVSLNEAVSAASETANDLVGFCGRNPAVCETGKSALKTFADKARYGANMLYEWAASTNTPLSTPASGVAAPSDGLGDQADAQSAISGKMDKINKANRLKPSAQNKSGRERRSQNTLSRDDLAPAWKGPNNNA